MTAVDFDPFAAGEVLLTAPATESQKEIWASVQMGDDANCAYNESVSLDLQGDLDVNALQLALQALIHRHEALRMTLSPDGVHLCITASPSLKVSAIDWSGLGELAQQQQIAEVQKQAVSQPFDLEQGPLFRVALFQLRSTQHLLILTAHHIVFDGWSWGVILPELGQLYSGFAQKVELNLGEPDCFSQYALALEQTEGTEAAMAAENYWLQQFADSIPVVDFPTDRPRPAFRTFDSDREDWPLSPTLVTDLKQLGTKLGCSLMSTLLAGFEVWLHRLTGQSDLVVGVLAAGQADTGMYHLVGHCVNLLPMRSWVVGEQSFSAYLQSRRTQVLDAYEHQQFTFGSLIQKLSIPRDSSRIPLVPILLNIDQGLDCDRLQFDHLQVTAASNPRLFENFELFVNATELAGQLTLECQYNTNLFDAATIRRRLAEFETLLASIVDSPDRPIATLPLLPVSEQQQLEHWNQTAADYPQDRCIHQLIEAQVERTPDAIAVVFEDQSLTYRQLDQRANQLSHYLRTQGVGAEVLVGICVERSVEMVVGVLGILKAGGAYLPLDPAYPADRIAFMLADTQLSVLLTQNRLKPNLPPLAGQVVSLDTDWQMIAAASPGSAALPPTVSPENLAYIIYTSGSTGKPKGVQIQHRSAVNLLHSVQRQPGLTAQDTLLSVTTLSFDIAVSEIFLPLMVGAKLVLVSQDVARDGLKLSQAIADCHATFMQPTPATWRLLLSVGWQGSPALKLISTGEALPRDLAEQLLPKGAELWNLYGPTETTIWATGCQVKAGHGSIDIGTPLANTQAYILDAQLQQVPIGVPGELHIGGAGLARGYLNRPALTAEKFIPHPFSPEPGARVYKTGDLARFLPNGQIECMGRIDHQVKIRGFRIELGEIEATLLHHSSVKEAIVLVREDTPGEKLLVGYFVSQSGTDGTAIISELRRALKAQLPDYMVPPILMALAAMPLTPNGKVDRKGLPQPDAHRPELAARYVAPQTHLETQIAEIWAQVLKLERVGTRDNFFESGGYSLSAMQVITRLRSAIEVELSLRLFFEAPTVAELADRIETLRWASQGSQAIATGAGHNDYEEGEL